MLALVLTVVPAVTALAAPDIEGHWAQDAIEQLVEVGAVSGLPDGTFRPDPVSYTHLDVYKRQVLYK